MLYPRSLTPNGLDREKGEMARLFPWRHLLLGQSASGARGLLTNVHATVWSCYDTRRSIRASVPRPHDCHCVTISTFWEGTGYRSSALANKSWAPRASGRCASYGLPIGLPMSACHPSETLPSSPRPDVKAAGGGRSSTTLARRNVRTSPHATPCGWLVPNPDNPHDPNTVGVWNAGNQRNAPRGTLGSLRRRTPEPEV